jgi:hypothetical protein
MKVVTQTTLTTLMPKLRQPKFNLEKAKELYLIHQLTYREIAAHFGLKDHAHVYRSLQPFIEHDTDGYAKNRVTLLRAKQLEILSAITPQKIEKASLQVLGMTYGILYDKERLELGKSTQVIDYTSLCDTEEKLRKRLDELKIINMDPELSTGYQQVVSEPDNPNDIK